MKSIFTRQVFWLTSLLFVTTQAIADHNAHHKNTYEYDPDFISAQRRLHLELQNYEKEIKQAISDYKEKTGKVWGDEVIVPDSKLDVTYRNALTERSIVDYEEGTVRVEVAITIEDSSNKLKVAEQLAVAVADAIVQGPDKRTFQEIAEEPDAPDTENPTGLAGLVANDDGSPLVFERVEEFSKTQLNYLERRSVTGKDGKVRFVYSTRFKLVPDHIKKRAIKYSKAVAEHAEKMRIPTPLIYAIMETESFFNPWAKSPVPAFGLMQLVPRTGARDAYRFLFNKDSVVKEKYLFNSDKNIELGVAYLHLLYYKYLEQVNNPTSKLWVMIAAYNTGVRNVMRAFAGSYNRKRHTSRLMWKKRALKKINAMNSEQVYEHLRRYLPQKETRDYIRKVRRRMAKYKT